MNNPLFIYTVSAEVCSNLIEKGYIQLFEELSSEGLIHVFEADANAVKGLVGMDFFVSDTLNI